MRTLLEKLNLTGSSLSVRDRIAAIKAEKAKIKQITDAFGCPEDDYEHMSADEIAAYVLEAIEKPALPDTLYQLHGGPDYFWRNFGSKANLIEFLKPFVRKEA